MCLIVFLLFLIFFLKSNWIKNHNDLVAFDPSIKQCNIYETCIYFINGYTKKEKQE